MNLQNYQSLISNLPVREQSFTTKRSTWSKAEYSFSWLKGMNDHLFDKDGLLCLNRQEIFDTTNVEETIIKTIFWGYPRGKRGNHFNNILTSFDTLQEYFRELRSKRDLTSADYLAIVQDFKKIPGLGLSTYSKIFYFLNLRIENNPCLILNQRIIEILQSQKFSSLKNLSGINSYNKEKRYPEYMDLMNILSLQLKTKPENLEQFLYLFNNLKPSET
jgi:hypothetical protein